MTSGLEARPSRRAPHVYHRPRCPFCRRLRAYAHEKGLPLALEDFDPKRHDAHLRALNPKAQVPTFDAGDGVVLYESFVIMQYLEEAHPEPSLLPDTPLGRAHMRLLYDLADNRLAVPMIAFVRAPKDHPSRSDNAEELAEYAAEAERFLSKQLPFALGERFSLGDLSLPPLLYRAVEAGFDAGRLSQRVRVWARAVLERPSVAELFVGLERPPLQSPPH